MRVEIMGRTGHRELAARGTAVATADVELIDQDALAREVQDHLKIGYRAFVSELEGESGRRVELRDHKPVDAASGAPVDLTAPGKLTLFEQGYGG